MHLGFPTQVNLRYPAPPHRGHVELKSVDTEVNQRFNSESDDHSWVVRNVIHTLASFSNPRGTLFRFLKSPKSRSTGGAIEFRGEILLG